MKTTRAGRALLEHVADARRGALNWQPVAAFVAYVDKGDERLILSIGRSAPYVLWHVACDEHDRRKPNEEPTITALREGLRTVLPPLRTLDAAIELAQRYAIWWRGNRSKPFPITARRRPPTKKGKEGNR